MASYDGPPVTVGVSFPVTAELGRLIQGVSPRVRLVELEPLIRERRSSEQAAARLEEALDEIEALFAARIPRGLVDRMPRLRWVQWIGTGIDVLEGSGVLEGAARGAFVLTNVRGTTALPMAEYVFMMMLLFAKKMPLGLRLQRERRYDQDPMRSGFLEGRTLGILGMGPIGQEIARLGKAFRMRVLAMHRTAGQGPPRVDVDAAYPPHRLRELLPQCDYLAIALPGTPETRRVIGAAELACMKPTAVLVNVGRGSLVDEPALADALREGRLAGAGLDVFEREPLPPESPLWDLPNVFVTPHVSGALVDNRLRQTRVFCENLGRYLRGEPLENVIDPSRGY